MTQRSLTDWLSFAESVHLSEIELGLDRVRSVAQRLALLPWRGRAVIVAGTNGKGSTCLALEALLLQQGLTVGTTLSPHLQRFNERVRLAGAEADDDMLCRAFAAVDAARENPSSGADAAAGHETPLTYFEFAILVALYCFAEQSVDVAILEVGLGGRLDACNIVDADLAVITSIGLDHQEFLGDTVEAIGAEKAGVLRRDQLAVLGADLPDSVWQQAAALDCSVYAYGRDFRAARVEYDGADLDSDSLSPPGWRFELASEHEFLASLEAQTWRSQQPPHNASLALVAATLLQAPPKPEHAALPALPGRMQRLRWHGRQWILDVTHNGAASGFLKATLDVTGDAPEFALIGQLANRKVSDLLAPWRFRGWVALGTPGPRGQSGAELLASAEPDWRARGVAAKDVAQALQTLCRMAPTGATILVFGSFAVVEAVRDHLRPDAGSSQ